MAGPQCICTPVDDSDGSASCEDNPNCPIHGWPEPPIPDGRGSCIEDPDYLCDGTCDQCEAA